MTGPTTATEVRAALQGAWTFEFQELSGERLPDAQLRSAILVFEGDRFTVTAGGELVHRGTLQNIDPVQKAMDAHVAEGLAAGTTMLGVYELDGDTLRVCFDMEGRQRPIDVMSPTGPGVFRNVHKRVK
jgi:uncharacterized protein (TIGR03067 family)